jgi:hypothetical protein
VSLLAAGTLRSFWQLSVTQLLGYLVLQQYAVVAVQANAMEGLGNSFSRAIADSFRKVSLKYKQLRYM